MSTAPGRFHTEPRIRAAYSEGAGIYRVVPSAVALPSSTAELAALMRWAAELGIADLLARALATRGGGL